MSELETVMASLYLALCGAIGREATSRANQILLSIADDHRTPASEATLLRDLVDCVEDTVRPSPADCTWWGTIHQLATAH